MQYTPLSIIANTGTQSKVQSSCLEGKTGSAEGAEVHEG